MTEKKLELTAWKVSKYGVFMVRIFPYSDWIRSFSGQYFPVFGLNTEIYDVNLRIQSEYEKIWIRESSVFRHFSRSDSFFFLRFLFIWANKWLPNSLKPKARVSDFVIDCFWNCQESEGRERKNNNFGTVFSFSNFSSFWKFRNGFWYQLKQVFLINYQY